MSMALAHFALGAALTTLLVTFAVPTVWYPRSVVLFGGVWAMLPDVHWVSPVWSTRLRAVHQASPLTDLFWFHRTLDRADPTDSKRVAAACLALLIVVTVVGEWRDYRAPRWVREAYGADGDASPVEDD